MSSHPDWSLSRAGRRNIWEGRRIHWYYTKSRYWRSTISSDGYVNDKNICLCI